jgi:hypothetical protein
VKVKLEGRPPKGTMQDIRIRDVPVRLAQRWKRAIGASGMTMTEWFILYAANTASDGKDKTA